MRANHQEYKLVVGENGVDATGVWQLEINRQYRMGWEFVATIQMPAQYGDVLYHAVWLFRKRRPEQPQEQEA